MGERAFRYDVKNKHKLVHSMRYWFNDTTKYGFAYQRFVALYDTRIFDSPVVITKVATGLPYILGPFIHPRQSFDIEALNGFNILKDGKSIEDPQKYTSFFIEKDGKSFLVRNDMFVAPRDVNHAIKQDVLNAYYAMGLNVYENWSASTSSKVLNTHESSIANQDNDVIEIYSNIFGKSHASIVNTRDATAVSRPKAEVNIYDEAAGTKHDSIVSMYQEYHGSTHTNAMTVFNLVLGEPHDNLLSIGRETLGQPDDNILNYMPLVTAKRIKDDRLSKEKILTAMSGGRLASNDSWSFLGKEQYESLIAQQGVDADIIVPYVRYLSAEVLLHREDYDADASGILEAYKTIRHAEANRVDNALRQNPYGHYDHYLLHGRTAERAADYEYYMRHGKADAKYAMSHVDEKAYITPKIGNVHADVYLDKDNPTVNGANHFLAVKTAGKHAALAEHFWSNKYIREATYYVRTLTLRDVACGDYITDTMFASQSGIQVQAFSMHAAAKGNAVAEVSGSGLFLWMDRKGATSAKKGLTITRDKTDARLYVQTLVDSDSVSISLYSSQDYVYRDRISSALYAMTFMTKDAQPISLTDALIVYKNPVDLSITSGVNVTRVTNHLFRQKMLGNAYKVRYGVDANEGVNAYRTNPGVLLQDEAMHAHNIVDGVQIKPELGDALKDKSPMYLTEATSLYLEQRLGQCYDTAMFVLKSALSVQSANAIDGVIKSLWHVRLNNFGSSHNGLIVPATKSYTDVSAFNNDIGKFAHKAGKDVFFTEGAMSSALSKPTFLSGLNYLNAEKMYHDVMMDVYNYYVEKSTIKAFVQQGDWLYHSPREAFVTKPVVQTLKDAFLGGHFDDEVWGAKDAYHTIVYDQIMTDIHKIAFDTHAYIAEFGDKGKYGTYFFYDVLSERTKYEMNVYGSLQTTEKDARMNLYSTLPFYNMHRDISVFEPVVYGDPTPRDLNVLQQLKAAEKARKEIEEFLSDFGNWAWVYETPSPFESKVYGIDELLLPEEDPRYEQFEDIIFDKETMTPRDPIKVLGPTSFLAKYPIEMPVEEYADVGVFYDDSAQKWEQYFGIETDVMKDIYLKYYQIWQAKIFEFSTMTMVQSTKKMLEYLYTWIDMYYPVDKMQQALRVFRQIRWYSESAVIRNSQYIISYEYDTLKSNLHTGVCHVPNDLDSITNPTMYVDKKNAVIRNDKAFLGQDAHVTFEIDVQKNTYIKFDLYTEYGKGTALIYLNGTLVRACTSAALGIIIQLPYTGSVNSVTIIKTGVNNIGEFYVGNISVPNATFKNLSIEFDPVLRAGNKPLEEVAKKMIACANLYADKNEMYAVIKRSSLGFSETYRQMNDYWKLHHQDKAKGKRLTIKQT